MYFLAKKAGDNSKSTGVITIRIDEKLDEILNDICKKNSITKAALIRNYLDMARYITIDQKSIRSLNRNDLLLLKKNIFKDILERFDEITQIDIGTELAQFINDLSRLEGNIDDIEYKLDMCEKMGLFQKFIDKENYILFSKEFGPEKFVEAFVWQLITKGDEGDFDKNFIESEMEKSSKLKSSYEKRIQSVRRDISYYAFGYAKIPEEK